MDQMLISLPLMPTNEQVKRCSTFFCFYIYQLTVMSVSHLSVAIASISASAVADVGLTLFIFTSFTWWPTP